MSARGSWIPGFVAMSLAGAGCAEGSGDAGGAGPLRCGPGTVVQDGFCVGVEDGEPDDGDGAGDRTPAPQAGDSRDEDPPAPADDPPAEADACGPCNTDGDCTGRCPGTHCVSIDGDRRCVPDEPADEPPPDDACADPCDLWAQCGCPVGQGCAIDGAGALGCVEAGSARQGESCAAEPCGPGYYCLADDTCAAYCDDDHACPGDSACIVELQDWDGFPLATLCWGSGAQAGSGCDLLADDCPAGESCALVDGDPGTECLAPGAVPADGACTYADDCEAGSSCVQFQDEDTAYCREHCDVGALSPCPAGRDCFGLDLGDAGICAP